MSSIKKTILAAGLAFSLGACSSMSGNVSYDNSADAIEAAKQAYMKALSADGAWRDTTKIIKAAEKLAAAGKEEEAIAMANKARMQGENGYKQAVSQQGQPASLPDTM